MADNPVKLTRGATNFATTSSTTLDLPNVRTQSSRKSANLINLPLPATDSGETIAFDLLGTTREISVNGQFVSGATGSTFDFVSDLDSLIDGNQGDTGNSQVGYTATLQSKSETIDVYVNDANWNYRAGDPSTIEYNVTLFQVSGGVGGSSG